MSTLFPTTTTTLSFLLLFISFSRITSTCRSHESKQHRSFFRCINRQFPGQCTTILDRFHSPTHPTYSTLLQNSTRNPRWFDSTSQRPFLIVTPQTEPEIRPVILCSRASGLQIRVNSGGHDYEGLSFRSPMNPFIMILMSNLNRTKIDITHAHAWIQTGASLGQLYYEIQRKSRAHAFPAGLYPSVGSGGHVSGGGLGTLTRKYGLASDNVLDARIMDANGTILDRKKMGEDLFWALRGGGGSSFGVILAWKLRLVRVPPEVTAFSVRRRLDFDGNPENLELLEKWQGNAYRAPDELFVRLLVQTAPDDDSGEKRFVQVTYNGLFLGPAERFIRLVNRTFPEFNFTVGDCLNHRPENNNNNNNNGCRERPCVKKECFNVSWIQSVMYFSGKKTDDSPEILLRKKANNMFNFHKGTSDFLEAPVPVEGWRMVHDAFLREEQPMMIIDPLGGRMDRISEDETPFPHRKGNLFSVQYLTYWGVSNNESEANKHLQWMRDLREKTKPYVAKSPRTAYINYKDLDLGSNDANFSYSQGKVWGEKYFKGNFERLARVKGKVDPSNFFRNELSIPVLLE